MVKHQGHCCLSDLYPGLPHATLVTDRHGSHFNMKVKKHQVCLAYLLRNAEYLNELNTEQTWSRRFIRYLMNAIKMRREETVTERKIKIKQKVSGCFRTDDGADIFAKVHSIVVTAPKNGNSKFNAILSMYP